MSLETLTDIHVLLSLIGILAGLVVQFGMIGGKRMDGMTAVFLSTTVATSVTGYLFPFEKILPSHIVGALSLVALAIAIAGRYPMHLAGGWRRAYVIGATVSLYFNVFVLVVQGFLKQPFLHELAPTQAEPPFAVAQGLVLVIFIWLGYKAVKGFHAAA